VIYKPFPIISTIKNVVFVSVIGLLLNACCTSVSSEKEIIHKEIVKDTLLDLKISEKKKVIENYLDTFTQNTSFNGGFLVAYKGKVIFENVFGMANKAKNEKLSLKSRFQLASVSKQFTATAIMILYQDSLLKIDDKVSQYIPDFPYKEITIRMLLTHRSGLPNYMYFAETLTNRKDIIYNNDVVNLMVKHKPAKYLDPNIKYNYCNTNYVLLASIVEKISGISFKEFVQKRIFDPAEMTETFIYEKGKDNPTENIALGYHHRWSEALHTYQEGVTGDKGIYATLGDMYKWDRVLYSEKILKKETIALMYEGGNPELKNNDYGFGWRISKRPEYANCVFHSGWYRGFNTIIFRDLKNEHTIIILANVRTKVIWNAYHQIYDFLTEREQTTNEKDLIETED